MEIKKILNDFIEKEGLAGSEVPECFGADFESCNARDCSVMDLCEKCSKLISEKSGVGVDIPKSLV